MKLYKLTNQAGETHGNTQWGDRVTHSVPPCENPRICSPDVLHAYARLNLGLLLNPIHANIENPHVYEALGEVCVQDWGKVGCFSLTTLGRAELPRWAEDREARARVQVQFAVLCAEAVLVHFESSFPSDDRPRKAIEAAKVYLDRGSAAEARAEIDFAALADLAVKIIEGEKE